MATGILQVFDFIGDEGHHLIVGNTLIHGHHVHFAGGIGFANIDVRYDDGMFIDLINLWDYAEGKSEQVSVEAFIEACKGYLAELTKHDADNFAEAGRRF